MSQRSKVEGLGGEDGFVPVFPDGVEIVVAEELGELFGGAGVVDGELGSGAVAGGGFFVGFEFDAASFDGAVEVVVSGAGVSAGFGV